VDPSGKIPATEFQLATQGAQFRCRSKASLNALFSSIFLKLADCPGPTGFPSRRPLSRLTRSYAACHPRGEWQWPWRWPRPTWRATTGAVIALNWQPAGIGFEPLAATVELAEPMPMAHSDPWRALCHGGLPRWQAQGRLTPTVIDPPGPPTTGARGPAARKFLARAHTAKIDSSAFLFRGCECGVGAYFFSACSLGTE